jgi:hypothetical protein
MTRVLLFALFVTTAGCQSERGGLLYRQSDRADDPRYSIEEQQRRGRERLAVVEDADGLAPKTYTDRPGVMGR